MDMKDMIYKPENAPWGRMDKINHSMGRVESDLSKPPFLSNGESTAPLSI